MNCIICGSWFSSTIHDGACPDCSRAIKRLGLDMTPERLLELARAEKDGRLVALPCKVGTPVWEIGDFDGGNLKRRPFCVEDMSFWRFGITVFLTREEADAALKKREEAT